MPLGACQTRTVNADLSLHSGHVVPTRPVRADGPANCDGASDRAGYIGRPRCPQVWPELEHGSVSLQPQAVRWLWEGQILQTSLPSAEQLDFNQAGLWHNILFVAATLPF